MERLGDIFNIEKGKRIKKDDREKGIYPLVTAGEKNNGVTEYINKGKSKLFKANITIDMFGNVFLQASDFYCDDNIIVLVPKNDMGTNELMYYVNILKHDKYRYNYGRQLREDRLVNLYIPSINEIPSWVYGVGIPNYESLDKSVTQENLDLNIESWGEFRLGDLFSIEASKNIDNKTARDNVGDIPYLTTSGQNNGVQCKTSLEPFYSGNVLTVAGSGTVLSTFYQPDAFVTSQRLYILKSKHMNFNQYIGMFFIPLIQENSDKFSQGRQVRIGQLNDLVIKLPQNQQGQPDYEFMERYIKSLKYSASI